MSRIPDMGIYAIENTITERVYVGSSTNLAKRLDLHRSDIARGYHINGRLRDELEHYGADVYRYVVLQRTHDALELEYLEDLWARRLGAYSADGYNDRQPTRRAVDMPTQEALDEFDEFFIDADSRGLSDMELARYLAAHQIVRPHGGERWNSQQVRTARLSVARRRNRRPDDL